jgi:hypothetical protein
VQERQFRRRKSGQFDVRVGTSQQSLALSLPATRHPPGPNATSSPQSSPLQLTALISSIRSRHEASLGGWGGCRQGSHEKTGQIKIQH